MAFFSLTSNASAEKEQEPQIRFTPSLPVLIIPGFMSSGLEIQESTSKPSWVGRRIWLNLVSLGFQSMHVGGPKKTVAKTSDEAAEGSVMRSAWLHHMTLESNMHQEVEGVKVRPIAGLSGVDYLTPGALTNHLSYVFGPVIVALTKVGYKGGINLDAAPYDWRLSPQTLEERDSYFTRTIAKVEDLYNRNGHTPVVLLCHSLGTKVGHYFLNFAKEAAGQSWIDKYIHTYIPLGGPHLGAPKAMRSMICGDKMSLDAFLSDSEALALGRSFGVGPYLVPKNLPVSAPPSVFVKREGAIEISISGKIEVETFVGRRIERDRPNKLKLVVIYNGNSLSTPFVSLDQDSTVSFPETFTFAMPQDGPPKRSTLTVLLCEPGMNRARKSDNRIRRCHMSCRRNFFAARWRCGDGECWHNMWMVGSFNPLLFLKIITCWSYVWILGRFFFEFGVKLVGLVYYYVVFHLVYQGTLVTMDEISRFSGGSSTLAAVKIQQLRELVDFDNPADLNIELVSQRDQRCMRACFKCACCKCGCCEKGRTSELSLSMKWIPPRTKESLDFDIEQPKQRCSAMCDQTGALNISDRLRHYKDADVVYDASSGNDLMDRENLTSAILAVKSLYDDDPLDPRGYTSVDPPPVARVKAIYGINLPTEVGAVYKRMKATVTRKDHIPQFYCLDRNARLEMNTNGCDAFTLNDGIVKEIGDPRPTITDPEISANTNQCVAGDGTVPYWSLQHVRTWASKCSVEVDEIECAEHREILANEEFHRILLEYVCTVETIRPNNVVSDTPVEISSVANIKC